jgi:transcription-repair coupling factor (superfamily II helicase)
VPQREADKLVQETILIVGPLIYEKSTDNTKRRSNECRQKIDILPNDLINTEPSDLISTESLNSNQIIENNQQEEIIEDVTHELDTLGSENFVPLFTNDQQKQLDEQLRNVIFNFIRPLNRS